MKITKIIALLIGVSSIATLNLIAGISVQIGIPAPVVIAPPPPAVVVSTVPDTYVWDGSEYVGVVGDQYFYLGPDHVWLRLDSGRTARFHDWERGHADWRSHAIRNESFRRDAHGHDVPFHDAPAHDVGHDNQNGHDHDHDHDH
jgi:hypothetical protein